jgi:hypothetical protein
MKIKYVVSTILLFLAIGSFGQNSISEIETKKGIRYITNKIDYSITGTYLFKGNEPIVELNGNGKGFYQLHDQPKRPMEWGIECDNAGVPKFIKGFDSAEYTLWYRYTDADEEWKMVEFSIHFNKMKMFIQGERSKDFNDTIQE